MNKLEKNLKDDQEWQRAFIQAKALEADNRPMSTGNTVVSLDFPYVMELMGVDPSSGEAVCKVIRGGRFAPLLVKIFGKLAPYKTERHSLDKIVELSHLKVGHAMSQNEVPITFS